MARNGKPAKLVNDHVRAIPLVRCSPFWATPPLKDYFFMKSIDRLTTNSSARPVKVVIPLEIDAGLEDFLDNHPSALMPNDNLDSLSGFEPSVLYEFCPFYAEVEVTSKSKSQSLANKIRSDRELGVSPEIYPYETCFDDDADVDAFTVDAASMLNRSKWSDLAKACSPVPIVDLSSLSSDGDGAVPPSLNQEAAAAATE